MPTYCAVKNCKSNSKNKNECGNIKFFGFPKDQNISNLWKRATGKKIVNVKYGRICSLHFSDDDWRLQDRLLNVPTTKRFLLPKAIPSQMLPEQDSCSESEVSISRIKRAEIRNKRKNVEDAIKDYSTQFILQPEDEEVQPMQNLPIEENTKCAEFQIERKMPNQWKYWCRLCGQENGDRINVFIKDEHFYNISEAIQQFFSITINITDEVPQKICTLCNDFVIAILNFSKRITKVQEMYKEIQLDPLTDLEKLRIKYNISQDENSFDNDMKVFVECDETNVNKISQDENSFDNDMKVFVDCDETNENNHIKFTEQMIKTPKITGKKENSFDNDVKVFVECDETNVTNHIKFTEQIIKTPKIMSKIKKHALPITKKNNSYDKTDLKTCDRVVNESVAVGPQECFSNQNNQCNNLNEDKKIIAPNEESKNCESITLDKEISGFSCKICEKKLATQSGYRLHMKFKHSIVIAKDSYPCTECGKVFQKFRNLTEHKKMHLPPEERQWHPCPHCDKKFTVYSYVGIHIRTVHEKKRPYICEECGKDFATNSLLLNHKLVHTDLKPFQCTKCPSTFKCSRSLKHHIDTHLDTKYMCPICQVQLNTKKILRLHMVIHSDVKKYKCNYCEKEFKRSKALKNHLISHIGIKPYECPFCEQTFANGSNCRKHQKLVHPIQLAEFEKSGEKRNCKKVPKLEQLQAVTQSWTVPENSIEKFQESGPFFF